MAALKYRFLKARLPRGFTFPLKRNSLDHALAVHNIRGLWLVSLGEPLPRDPDLLIVAYYHGEAAAARGTPEHLDNAGTTSVHFYAVPLAERSRIEHAIVDEALPSLCAWLRRAESEGNTWRAMNHRVDFRLNASRVVQLEQ
jgi:hypothetical protein